MRPIYGRFNVTYRRTCSFIGTGNVMEFLKDATGNRRFWPITVLAEIDTDRLAEALPQLLGETMWRLETGELSHVTDEEALAQSDVIRDRHFEESPLDEDVRAIVIGEVGDIPIQQGDISGSARQVRLIMPVSTHKSLIVKDH